MLVPAATATGALRPVTPNPFPARVACEIERAAVPVFESFTVWLAEVFTVRVPKLIALGVRLIAGVDVVTPVPVRLTVTGVLLALLLIEMLPKAAPAVVG